MLAACRPACTLSSAVASRSGAQLRSGAPLARVAPRRSAARPVAALPGADSLPAEVKLTPQLLTLVGYAVTVVADKAKISIQQLTFSHISTALAAYTLLWGALTLADVAKGSDVVGGVIGPVFLAINALDGFGKVAPFEAASLLFGYQLVDTLPAFEYSKYVWLATLVAALYKGLGAQWLVGAYGLAAAWKLVQDKSVKDYKQVAFVALAAWAFYKQVEVPVALFMMAAAIVSSAIN